MKGPELLKEILEGNIKEGTRLKCKDVMDGDEYTAIYKNETIWFEDDEEMHVSCILGYNFEIIEEQEEINIQDIEHKELEIVTEILGKCDIWEGNENYFVNVINSNISKLVDKILELAKENKILVQAIKQLDRQIKENK